MTHWAAKYIDVDYHAVGMCWGLMQIVCLERHGCEMPPVAVGTREDQTLAIKRAAQASGWRRVDCTRPVADDIVVMTGVDGRHVGYAVEADGQIGVLHAKGTPAKGGRVVFDPWSEMTRNGFHSFEFWRRA